MAIDSIALQAQNSYTKAQDQPRVKIDETSVVGAVQFQSMVEKQFNSFSKMTPTQILEHIQNAKSPTAATVVNSGSDGNIAFGAVRKARDALQHQEHVVRKSLIGEASLIDVLTTTTEAKNVLDTTVKVRDKFLEAFDKVMNMAI